MAIVTGMLRRRQRVAATDNWQQRDLLVRSPEQRKHERIRPVVLFGHSPAERARQTGAPQRTHWLGEHREQLLAVRGETPPQGQR